jgi:hypothetical protein
MSIEWSGGGGQKVEGKKMRNASRFCVSSFTLAIFVLISSKVLINWLKMPKKVKSDKEWRERLNTLIFVHLKVEEQEMQ